MTRYSVQARDVKMFVKDHGFLFFAKNICKNIAKNISKNENGKYSQKLLDHTKQSATDALKTTSKRVIQKATGDMISNKNANKIMRIPKNSQQNNSEKVTNEHDKGITKERYKSPEGRKKIIE